MTEPALANSFFFFRSQSYRISWKSWSLFMPNSAMKKKESWQFSVFLNSNKHLRSEAKACLGVALQLPVSSRKHRAFGGNAAGAHQTQDVSRRAGFAQNRSPLRTTGRAQGMFVPMGTTPSPACSPSSWSFSQYFPLKLLLLGPSQVAFSPSLLHLVAEGKCPRTHREGPDSLLTMVTSDALFGVTSNSWYLIIIN